ncbi:MAG: DUF2809 domain-containing protein [Bacteroidota bacterium]
MRLTFKKPYFLACILLLLVEVLIAAFAKDSFIRPYVGDFLVVMLIYAFLKSFTHLSVWQAAMGSLVFSYLVEFSQYLGLIKWLGLKNNLAAKLILGNAFSWEDMLAYTLGILLVLIVERKNSNL